MAPRTCELCPSLSARAWYAHNPTNVEAGGRCSLHLSLLRASFPVPQSTALSAAPCGCPLVPAALRIAVVHTHPVGAVRPCSLLPHTAWQPLHTRLTLLQTRLASRPCLCHLGATHPQAPRLHPRKRRARRTRATRRRRRNRRSRRKIEGVTFVSSTHIYASLERTRLDAVRLSDSASVTMAMAGAAPPSTTAPPSLSAPVPVLVPTPAPAPAPAPGPLAASALALGAADAASARAGCSTKLTASLTEKKKERDSGANLRRNAQTSSQQCYIMRHAALTRARGGPLTC